jgi:dethiobiotin synthetase
MSRSVFVTGTDTGAGKTAVACALLRGLHQLGHAAIGFKPVASGATWRDGKLLNDDALALIAASATDLGYAEINPYCFAPAIAPHLAAREAGVAIDPARLRAQHRALAARFDWVIVEGAGGWRVPLTDTLDMQGLAQVLGVPVVLVVGLRLGCINHALLTEQAVTASGMALAGWIGSMVDPDMSRRDENIDTLRRVLTVPCLGVLDRSGDAAVDEALARGLLGVT